MPTFHHSGDFGDIIYCLPTMRALGGGSLELGPAPGHGTRLPMTIERYETIKPLLEIQPYVEEVTFGVNKCDYDLDIFRFHHQRTDLNLAERSLVAHNLDPALCATPWLTRPIPINLGKTVAINRTWDRHHNALFCWPDVLANYGANAVFLGLEIDYNEFRKAYRMALTLPWYQCANLLEMAMVIAGVDLFIGNQSAGYAIAEGFKMHTYIEVSHQMPNCIFHRPGAHYFPDLYRSSASATRVQNPPAPPATPSTPQP